MTGWSEAIFVQTDVSQTEDVQAMVATCIREYGQLDIAVNNAGIEGTPMVERAFDGDEEMRNRFKAMHPVGRFGKPEEVASATLWLCSEGAAFTIGHALAVDGGRLI